MEDFKSNLLKIIHVSSYDTKKLLSENKDDLSKFTNLTNERVQTLDSTIHTFIGDFISKSIEY